MELSREHLLQGLLTECFRLAPTSEVKQFPVYEITSADVSPRVRRSVAGVQYEQGTKWGGDSSMEAHIVSYEFIAGHTNMIGQDALLDQLMDRLNQN